MLVNLSSGIGLMLQQCSRLQGKWSKHHKCRDLADLWVTSLRVSWLKVAVLCVELRTLIQMLLEISSHCSTEKVSTLR